MQIDTAELDAHRATLAGHGSPMAAGGPGALHTWRYRPATDRCLAATQPRVWRWRLAGVPSATGRRS